MNRISDGKYSICELKKMSGRIIHGRYLLNTHSNMDEYFGFSYRLYFDTLEISCNPDSVCLYNSGNKFSSIVDISGIDYVVVSDHRIDLFINSGDSMSIFTEGGIFSLQ